MVRKNIIFSGFVQGVGFRYRAKYAAERFGLTGWVENLYNGNVEMEIQGDASAIDQAVSCILQGRFISVENMQVRSLSIEEEERSFQIR